MEPQTSAVGSIFFDPFYNVLEQCLNVCSEKFHGDCEQDNTKEFAGNVDTALPEECLHLVGHTHYEIHPKHVKRKSYEDVDTRILCSKRKQGGESSCAGE